MKEKYIEERHPRWFSMCVGMDDITDANETAFASAVNATNAEEINERHNKLLDALIAMAQAWDKVDPEEFSYYWYGEFAAGGPSVPSRDQWVKTPIADTPHEPHCPCVHC